MSADERATMLAMQGYPRDYTIQVMPAGGNDNSPRAFQWDTNVDGYPLISRCFSGDKMTLDLHFESIDRKPLASELFQVPSGYKKEDLGGMEHKGGKKHGK
jgi:hypothetical protein